MDDESAVQREEFGIVKLFINGPGYGYIQRKQGQDAWFHHTSVLCDALYRDQPVRFKVRRDIGRRNPIAYDIQTVE